MSILEQSFHSADGTLVVWRRVEEMSLTTRRPSIGELGGPSEPWARVHARNQKKCVLYFLFPLALLAPFPLALLSPSGSPCSCWRASACSPPPS